MAQSLSDTTKAEYKRAFEIFDKNGDGFIEKNDLASLMAYLKFFPSDTELEEMIGEFSEGKSNKIAFQDFLEMIATRLFDGNAENDLLQAFRVFDKEGRGVINAMNLREAISDVDNDLSKEEMTDLLHGLIDTDGNVNYTKLIRDFLFN